MDASSTVLGAVIMQGGKPIALSSKTLTTSERRNAREMLATVWGAQKSHTNAYGRRVIVEMENKPLESIFKKPPNDATPRLQGMLLKLTKYDLDVKYIPGKQQVISDCLSRKPLSDTEPVSQPEYVIGGNLVEALGLENSLLMINELPMEHIFRKKFIIPAYIYCDKHDPNMLTFLNPLVEKLNTLYKAGIQGPGRADGNITVRYMLFVATVDLPVRASLVNMKQFNCKCACQLCKSEGTGYGQHNLHRCWPYEQDPEKRTHQEQANFATNPSQKQAVMGVRGHLIFAKLRYPFDLIRSSAIDWMTVCVWAL